MDVQLFKATTLPDAWFQVGDTLGELAVYPDAAAAYDEVIRLRPEDPAPWEPERPGSLLGRPPAIRGGIR